MIVRVACECWKLLDSIDLKLSMLRVIYYCYITSEVRYLQGCPWSAWDCSDKMDKMFVELNEIEKGERRRERAAIEEVFNSYVELLM